MARRPEFVLNQAAYLRGTVLVAGPNFGSGSSREHAVWALQNYGFKAVISARFAGIFRCNCGKAGLVAAQVDDDTVAQLWGLLGANPGAQITVDLVTARVTAGDQNRQIDSPFKIDHHTRSRLLEGLDHIAATLAHESDIEAFEAQRPAWLPKTIQHQLTQQGHR